MDKEKLFNSFIEWVEKNFGGSQDNHKEYVESDQEIIKSVDEMERRALFVVLEPQEDLDEVADLHGDYYDEITIEKACISYNKHSRKAGLYHKYIVDESLVEVEQSFITPTSFDTDEGITVKKGSWLMWLHFPKPEDDAEDLIWPQVLSGEFNGISVECAGKGYLINEE